MQDFGEQDHLWYSVAGCDGINDGGGGIRGIDVLFSIGGRLV